MKFEIGEKVLYEPSIDNLQGYDYAVHGALRSLVGKYGVICAQYPYADNKGLIGVDFGIVLDKLHRLGLKIPDNTGLWVDTRLLYKVNLKEYSYEEML